MAKRNFSLGAKRLGFTPEADRFNTAVFIGRGRSGVHKCMNGVEMVSLYDLVEVSKQSYNRAKGKNYGMAITSWYDMIKNAVENGSRMIRTVKNLLDTDAGWIYIHKSSQGETFFIALEDADKLFDAIAPLHKITAKRMREGWAALNSPEKAKPCQGFREHVINF